MAATKSRVRRASEVLDAMTSLMDEAMAETEDELLAEAEASIQRMQVISHRPRLDGTCRNGRITNGW